MASLVVHGQAGQHTFRERVDVPRVLVDVRVTDGSGRAISDLAAGDFEVKIDGKASTIDTVEWVDGDPANTVQHTTASRHVEELTPPVTSRWIVFVYQKHPDLSDVEGFIRLRTDIVKLVNIVRPQDHVAVLSFDQSLHYWLDFTDDTKAIRQVMTHDLLVAAPPHVGIGGGSALTARLTPQRGARSYSIEESLRVLGAALEPLPGPKTIIVFGYGMGTWLVKFGAVLMSPDFGETVAVLQNARVSVFCVDITKADYHPREEGLRTVARETGGFYVQSYQQTVFDQLAGALAGYYVLLVVPPDAHKGQRRIDVSLRHRRGTVVAKQRYFAQ